MVDRSQIRSGMEVVASDGAVVGVVDQLEGEAIRLARGADGRHHLVPLLWVERVDAHVHLNVGRDRLATVTGAQASGSPGLGTATAAGAAAGGLGAAAAAHPTPSTAGGDDKLPGPLPPVSNPTVEGARPRGNFYLPWVLGLLLAILLLVFLVRGCEEGIEDARDVRDSSERPAIAAQEEGAANYAPGTIAYELSRFLASDEPAPRTFTFDRLNFDTRSAAIRQSDILDMDQLAQVLAANPAVRIGIVGYTDAEGGRRSNARLGEERAESVVAALTARGIDRSRLEARSGGEQAPVATNAREEGRAENRRTELIVLSR